MLTAASESNIGTDGLYRRAETLLLIDRLERFVNLEDTREAYQAFFEENTSFHPVEFYDSDASGTPQERQPLAWRPEFHRVFLEFRDMLREIWQRNSDSSLGILLGTEARAWAIINRRDEANLLDKIFSSDPDKISHSHEVAIEEAVQAIPKSYLAMPQAVRPDWRTGNFRYKPDTDFRRAVYLLFRQSWRAKVCPRCHRYFVADKPPQLYCSTKCYGEAKKDRDLEYWRNTGSSRRDSRVKQRRKGSSEKKRRPKR